MKISLNGILRLAQNTFQNYSEYLKIKLSGEEIILACKKIHPTQKPIELYAYLFSKFANPGDKILDTHLGSGSSRIAAYDAGLDFVGFEINRNYFDKQEDRFEAYTAQTTLFQN